MEGGLDPVGARAGRWERGQGRLDVGSRRWSLGGTGLEAGGEEGEKRGEEEASAAAAPGEELGSERSRSGSFSSSSSSAGVRCYGVFRHTILKCTRDQPFEMQWSTRGMLYDLFFFLSRR